jgi:hypothetical protein
VTLTTHAIIYLAALLLVCASCVRSDSFSAPPVPAASELPDTRAQVALVRQYVDLLAAERYADAWQLLSPGRQLREPPDAFAAEWRARDRVGPQHEGFPFFWPASMTEVRADVWLQDSTGSVGLQRIVFDLVQADGVWRIADEHGPGHHERTEAPTIAPTPVDLARAYVVGNYGPMWLRTLEVLAQEPFEDGQVVVFGALNPLLEPKTKPTPAAILLFAHPRDGRWTMAGGGAIGTMAEMGRYAVSCAWTWLRFVAHAPTTAAFYCTVEDPRIGKLELETVEGAFFQSHVAGKRAVLFPYPWNMQERWPAQQPRALRLYDSDGRMLSLPTSPLRDERP